MRSIHRREQYEIIRSRGSSGRGAYTQDRSLCTLGVYLPSIYLLPRREKYTRVYTVVYPRVHNCIHACTLPRSQYVPSRALWYVSSSGLTPRRTRDTAGASLAMKYYTKGVKEWGILGVIMCRLWGFVIGEEGLGE